MPAKRLAPLLSLTLALLSSQLTLADARDDGMQLAAELRQASPPEEIQVEGLIRMRHPSGQRTAIPFSYRVEVLPHGWNGIYSTPGGEGIPQQTLTVLHQNQQPNLYTLQSSNAPTQSLQGPSAMTAFAHSDFWLADLGLDYLHWPEHRILEHLKIKMRKGRPCQILESINPDPSAKGYTRVLSWIDRETRKPIIAEAYAPDGSLLKEFEVGGVTKVNGVWELKNLEMRNVQKDSLTLLEFQYESREE